MVKDIVVNLTGGAPQEFAADYAISLAQLFDAHIAGVGFIYEPVIPGTVLGGIPTDLIEAQREENTKAAKAATSRFEAAAGRAGLSAEVRIIDASVAGAADLFGRIARRFDLAVVGQARPKEGASEELLIEGALFESGRPVVVVPYVQTQGVTLNRVLVLWDGSRPATRAIADALPFLRHAERAVGDPVANRRDRRRLHRDGRLRAFAPAGIHPRRRHPHNSDVKHDPGADVALVRARSRKVDGGKDMLRRHRTATGAEARPKPSHKFIPDEGSPCTE